MSQALIKIIGNETLIGVIVGGLITYFVEKGLQNRQFKKDEKDKKEIWRSYLSILKEEIAEDYKRLTSLRDNIYGSYPTEYFDITNKRTIVAEFIKTTLFLSNTSIFNRITFLMRKLSILNNEIDLVQSFIAGRIGSALDQEYKTRQARDNVVSTINEILNNIIMESNGKLDLVCNIEDAIKKL